MTLEHIEDMLSSRLGRVAVALLVAVPALLVLSPALFGGESMFPAGYFAAYVPWRGVSPLDPTLGNPLLSDLPLVLEPALRFARESIRSGVLPMWNPRVLAGTPFYTNPQAGLFSPFNLPVWAASFRLGVAVAALLKLWVAGLGAYLLARELGAARVAAIAAGLSFSVCSFNVVWLGHGAHVAVVALLPFVLLFAERFLRTSSPADFLGVWTATLIAMLGGHPGSQVHLVLCVAIYVLARFLSARGGDTPVSGVGVASVGLAVLGGIAAAGFLLVPQNQAAAGTLGEVARHGGGLALHAESFVTALFPDWWGRPTGASVTGSLGKVPPVTSLNYSERTIFAGVLAFPLALLAVLDRDRLRTRLPLIAIGLAGLLLPLGFLPLHAIVGAVPFVTSTTLSRITVWFELAVAVLAALGIQDLIERRVTTDRLKIVGLFVGVVAAAALAVTAAKGLPVADAVSHLFDPRQAAGSGALALAAVLWALAVLAAGALAVVLIIRGQGGSVSAGCALLLVLIAVDMWHFADGFQAIGPTAKVVPGPTPAVRFLQQHSGAGRGRFAGLGAALPNDYGMNFGLFDVRGQDPPQPSMDYVRLWRKAGRVSGGFRLELDRRLRLQTVRVLRVLGTEWLVARPGSDPGGLPVAYRGRDATIVRIPRAIPRVVVPATVSYRSGPAAVNDQLAGPKFDPRRAAAVTERRSARAGAGSARVISDGQTDVRISARMSKRGLVVLNDAIAPGWKVTVDGAEARAVTANSVMRGVIVPAGRHTVAWSYSPVGILRGAVVSVLGLLMLAAGLWTAGRRRNGGVR